MVAADSASFDVDHRDPYNLNDHLQVSSVLFRSTPFFFFLKRTEIHRSYLGLNLSRTIFHFNFVPVQFLSPLMKSSCFVEPPRFFCFFNDFWVQFRIMTFFCSFDGILWHLPYVYWNYFAILSRKLLVAAHRWRHEDSQPTLPFIVKLTPGSELVQKIEYEVPVWQSHLVSVP